MGRGSCFLAPFAYLGEAKEDAEAGLGWRGCLEGCRTSSWFDGAMLGPSGLPRLVTLPMLAEGGEHTGGLHLSSAQRLEGPAPWERSKD